MTEAPKRKFNWKAAEKAAISVIVFNVAAYAFADGSHHWNPIVWLAVCVNVVVWLVAYDVFSR